jgi:hypothetical protein
MTNTLKAFISSQVSAKRFRDATELVKPASYWSAIIQWDMFQAGQYDGERAHGDRDPLLPLPLQQDHRQPLRGPPGHPEPPPIHPLVQKE